MEVEVLSRGLIDLSIMDDIANAINLKLSSSGTMTPSQMASNINSIPTGGSSTLGPGVFTSNGSYSAAQDQLDGYNTVTISVPTTSLSQLSVNLNGNYTAPSGYSYDEVTVDVAIPILSTLSVSSNGNYLAPSGTAYNYVDVDVQPTLSLATFINNGEYPVPSGYDGYGTVTVSVPGAPVLGSKTISINGVYSASSDNFDGYDVVTVDVSSGIGEYYFYSDGIDVTATVDDVNLTNSSSTTNFYDTYESVHINTLTINAGTSTSLSNFNKNPKKQLYFKKLVLGDGVKRADSFTGAEYDTMREFEVQTLTSFSGTYCRSCVDLVKATYNTSLNLTLNQYHFADCRSLEIVNLPTTISIIPSHFCNGCYNLTEINVNELENLTTISNNAFYYCRNIKDINFSILSNLTSIGNNTFTYTKVSEVKSSFLTTIGTSAFSECKDLISIDIPNVDNLGTNVFEDCKNLISVTLCSSLSQIPNYTFQSCTNLKELDLSYLSNCTQIGTNSMKDCYKLSTVLLPSATISLGTSCFQNNYNLSSIDIENITTFGASAFYGCSNLTSVTLNSSLTLIPQSCFSAAGLISLEIPSTVVSISNFALSTSTLKDLILYDTNVISITNSAFSNSLSDIYYRGSPGKSVGDLETEYNSRYGNTTGLKPSTTRTIHYVPYEEWNV